MIELAGHRSEHGAVTIFKSASRSSHIYMNGDAFQSEADSRGISLASYIHALYGLIHQQRSRSVLVIGCAGGTLATMLALGGFETTIIDVNPVSFEFARAYFCLPGSVECHVADGFDYLAGTDHRFDSIVLDAYDGSVVPARLTTTAFLLLVRSQLNSGGCFFANIHMRDDWDRAQDALAANAKQVWPHVRILDSPGVVNRNAIVAAGSVGSLVVPRLLLQPAYESGTIEGELAALEFF
jgi:spermidine synthase